MAGIDLHAPVDSNKSYVELTYEEKMRYDHQKMHAMHEGHESMHVTMVGILMIVLVIAQIVFVQWKKYHYRSYSFFTMVTMWVLPLIMSLKNIWIRFVSIWMMFTAVTAFILRQSTRKPMSPSTPRLVYKWFYLIYKVCCVVGLFGYTLMILTLFNLNSLFGMKAHKWMDAALLTLFYGLYFGVLGRDVSEYCSERMAASIGYYTKEGIPTRLLERNVCAVCGNRLLVSVDEEGVLENTYKLTCGHVFHEFCIRGWCIVGKKQTCPYCKEKVDLKRMFTNPWDRPHILYGQMLDWIRWIIAWQPLVIFLVQGINWLLGLE
ncbi:RING finger protein 121 [Colias croceus]|uniref:RING finger protein 121 n=1 Tax=Colias crocea TaxID=72248 RepID=UPI001E2809AC|nr:RING finger protein 121 [Colias croceus]